MASRAIDVVAALVWRDGRLLVTQRPPGTHLGGLWEFPGGKIESGEQPAAALVREVREELAIEIAVGPLREEVVHTYPEKTVRLLFFDCRWLDGEPQHLAVADHRWISRDDLAGLEFPPADQALLAGLESHFAPLLPPARG